MKKFLVFGLFVMLSTVAFAATSYTGTTLPTDGNNPVVNVQYVIDANTGRYSVGFAGSATDAANGTSLSNPATITLAIDSEDNTIVSNVQEGSEDTKLYVFWDITSAAAYKLSLETTALVNKEAQENNLIGIEVAGSSVDENGYGELVNFKAESASAVSDDIIPLTTAGTIATKKGMQMLTIKSTADQLSGKATGTYSAGLTLKLTAN